jgi:glycosyltransferase involved in cell wall biosynthesis
MSREACLNRKETQTALKSTNSLSQYDFEESSYMHRHLAGCENKTTYLKKAISPPKMSVGIVIPARNEEKNIKDIICRLRELGYDNILVIDGKSQDATSRIAEINGAKVVAQTGLGKGNAVRQALAEKYFDVDALVLMDADGSMAPEEVPLFVEALASGADVVKGSRFCKGGCTYDMTLTRRIGNELMMLGVNILFSTKYTDLCYGFAVLNKRAVEALAPKLQSNNFEIEAEIFIKAAQIGLEVKEVPSTEFKRKYGTSNLRAIRDGVSIFTRIFKEFLNSEMTDF